MGPRLRGGDGCDPLLRITFRAVWIPACAGRTNALFDSLADRICHPREGGDPSGSSGGVFRWAPACAGATWCDPHSRITFSDRPGSRPTPGWRVLRDPL